MIPFAFGVLGSIIFWIVISIVWFVAYVITLKHIAPETFRYITNNNKKKYYEDPGCFIVTVTVFILWPIILFILTIIFIFEKIIGPIVANCFKLFLTLISKTSKIIPEIEIKTKKKEENGEKKQYNGGHTEENEKENSCENGNKTAPTGRASL